MPLQQFHLEGRDTFSKLQEVRRETANLLPDIIKQGPHLSYDSHEALGAVADHEDIEKAFPKTYGRARISLKSDADASKKAPEQLKPLRVAVVLSGGQAPGGHNVIAGVYDYIKRLHPDSVLIGFMDGPQGSFHAHSCNFIHIQIALRAFFVHPTLPHCLCHQICHQIMQNIETVVCLLSRILPAITDNYCLLLLMSLPVTICPH
jgi:hypothetical protein